MGESDCTRPDLWGKVGDKSGDEAAVELFSVLLEVVDDGCSHLTMSLCVDLYFWRWNWMEEKPIRNRA